MYKKICFALVSLLLVACTTVDFSPANSGKNYAPTVSSDEVKIFRSEKPSQPYQEIGLVHLKGESRLGPAMSAMKEKAAAKGGNAIIDIKVIPGGSVGTVVIIK